MNPEANSNTKFAHFEDNPNIIHIKVHYLILYNLFFNFFRILKMIN